MRQGQLKQKPMCKNIVSNLSLIKSFEHLLITLIKMTNYYKMLKEQFSVRLYSSSYLFPAVATSNAIKKLAHFLDFSL